MAGVQNLVSPGQEGDGCASITSPVTECSNTATILIDQELKIVELSLSISVACKSVGPAVLLLEAVLEVDKVVGEAGWKEKMSGIWIRYANYMASRTASFRELLETQNDVVLRRVGP